MVRDPGGGGAKSAYAMVTGALYILGGGLQLVAGVDGGGRWSEALLLGGGAIDGAVLMIVGLVLLQGHRELRQGMAEGVAFVYMGILLGLFFAVVDLGRVGAEWLEGAVLGDGGRAEAIASVVSPALYLSPLPISGFLAWRSSFTLTPGGGRELASKALKNDKEARQ